MSPTAPTGSAARSVPDRFAGITRPYTAADVERLSGSLKVHANLCGVAGGSTTIASYGGWSGAFSVYQGSGTLSL